MTANQIDFLVRWCHMTPTQVDNLSDKKASDLIGRKIKEWKNNKGRKPFITRRSPVLSKRTANFDGSRK